MTRTATGSRSRAATALALAALFLGGCGPAEPEVAGTPPDVRRLTEDQYRNIIADVFGSAVVVGGRFDPPVRAHGLLAVGARDATVTPGSMRQYDEMARSIASQALSARNRGFLVPCALTPDMPFDDSCAERLIGQVGRLLFRRPLTTDEVKARVATARDAASALGRFEDGLHIGLSSLLVAPQFLFVAETVEPDPEAPGRHRLDAFAKASRLSFLLWNTAPDDALLSAAESGRLQTGDGLAAEVDRMMASARLETGVRAFFSDMFSFSGFKYLEKDTVIYPAFDASASQDAQEQILRTIAHHVIEADDDYRDLFTTRSTFMTRTLGQVYRVQVQAPKGVWQSFEFPADDSRAGIQSLLGFLALNSHPGRSSPTLRGKAIRTMLLCQQVPTPPPDVDFTEFNNPDSPSKTARERLAAHSTNPTCAGCHRIIDPIGLALENFDGAGQFRGAENGQDIDASGALDGVAFSDASGLGPALRDNPATASCVVSRLFPYASGRALSPQDPWMAYLERNFADDGYRFSALLRRVATSKAMYAVSDLEPSTATMASRN